MNIAFDIDGVVANLVLQVSNLLEIRGYELIENNKFMLETKPELLKSEIWQYIELSYEYYDATPIYWEAFALFDKLYKITGQPIKFVTSRPTRVAHWTHGLIKRVCKNIPFEISFAEKPFNKIHYLKKITYFVEDRRKIALDLAENQKLVFLIDKPYNQMPVHPRIWRIQNIRDIITLIGNFA